MKQIKLFTIIAFIILGNLATVQAQAKVDIDGDEGANTTSQNVDWDRVMALRKQISDANVQLGNLAQTLWKNGDPVSAIINSFEPTAEEKLNAINEYLSKNKTTFNTFKNVSDKIAKLRYEECSLQRDCGSFQDYKSKNGIRNISSNRYSAILLAKKEWESKAQSSGNSGNKSNNTNTSASNNNSSDIGNETKANSTEKTYEEIVAEQNAKTQKINNTYNDVSNQMSSLFSDGIQGNDFYAISQTFANSNMKTEALTSVALGTAIDFGGGILKSLKQAREDKIKNKIKTISNNESQFKDEIDLFQSYLKSNQYDDLIDSHKKLLKLELNSLIESQWLIQKHSSDFKKYVSTVIERQNNRIELVMKINTELFNKASQNISDDEIINLFVDMATKESLIHLSSDTSVPFPNFSYSFQAEYLLNLDYFLFLNRLERRMIINKLYKDNKINNVSYITILLLDPINPNTLEAINVRELFLSLQKEKQIEILSKILNKSILRNKSYHFYENSSNNPSNARYSFSNISLLLDKGNGLNYYLSVSNDIGNEIPLYEFIIKSIKNKKGSLSTTNGELISELKELVKKDERLYNKKKEILFQERKDCENPSCSKTIYIENTIKEKDDEKITEIKSYTEEIKKKYLLDNKDIEKYKKEALNVLSKYDNILDLDSKSRLHNNIGIVYMRKRELDLAISHFEKAINFNKKLWQPYKNIVTIMLEKDSQLVDDLNDNKMSNKKYKLTIKEREDLLNDIIPYLEKIVELKEDNAVFIEALLFIYESLYITKEKTIMPIEAAEKERLLILRKQKINYWQQWL